MDRWIALADLRPFGIHPMDVEAWQLSDEPLCLRAWIEGIPVDLLESARDFFVNFHYGEGNSLASNNRFDDILEEIDNECKNVIERYTSQTPICLDPILCVQDESAPHTAHLVSWLMSCAFIQCFVAMRFICTDLTDLTKRLTGLRCATNLMSLVPFV